jgi:hypothetical protein
VVEVHALKQAGKELDVSRLPNRGVYDAPGWIKDVKLQKTGHSDFVLSLPGRRSLETFLEEMQRVSEYVSEQQQRAFEEKFEPEDELVVEQPEPPVMDPDTPAFRRAALVKQDAEKKFDFMSNRPVPRASPIEPVAQPLNSVKETVVVETEVKPIAENVATVKETVVVEASSPPTPGVNSPVQPSTPITEMLEASSLAAEKNVAALRKDVHGSITSLRGQSVERITPAEAEAKWRDVPLTDVDIKFAVSLVQHFLLYQD